MKETRFFYGSMDLKDLDQYTSAYDAACAYRKALKEQGKETAMRRDSISNEYVVTEF